MTDETEETKKNGQSVDCLFRQVCLLVWELAGR